MTINRLETDAPIMAPWEIEMEVFAKKMGKMLPPGMSMAILTTTPLPMVAPGGGVVHGAQTLGCKLLSGHVGAMLAWTQLLLGMTVDQLEKHTPTGSAAFIVKLRNVMTLFAKASGQSTELQQKPVIVQG